MIPEAADWKIKYSKGFPDHPKDSPEGWYLNFSGTKELDYIQRSPGKTASAKSIVVTVRVEGTFKARQGGDPHLTVILRRKGDDLSGVGKYADYRLWYGVSRIPFVDGTHTITVPMTRAGWTNVNGKKVSDGAWASMLKNLQAVGVTAGGMFYGHGVRGEGRITMTNFEITR
jgi:hypothetical protein